MIAWDLDGKTYIFTSEMGPVLLIRISFVIGLLPQDKLTQYFQMELSVTKEYFKL